MEEENIAFRLKFLIQKLGINSTEFADTCGISRATLSQLLTGRNKKISDKILGQIHHAYPNVSIMWLLFNEGTMLIGQPSDDLYGASEQDETLDTAGEDKAYRCDSLTPHNENFQPDSSKIIPENSINASGRPDLSNNSKENGLNGTHFIHQATDNNTINPYSNFASLDNKIENSGPKQRNVVQITIYYDDNTFECFYPGKS